MTITIISNMKKNFMKFIVRLIENFVVLNSSTNVFVFQFFSIFIFEFLEFASSEKRKFFAFFEFRTSIFKYERIQNRRKLFAFFEFRISTFKYERIQDRIGCSAISNSEFRCGRIHRDLANGLPK